MSRARQTVACIVVGVASGYIWSHGPKLDLQELTYMVAHKREALGPELIQVPTDVAGTGGGGAGDGRGRGNSNISPGVNRGKSSLFGFLPARTMSSMWGKINSYNLPTFLRSTTFGFYCYYYECDMTEALDEDYRNYRNLGEFFSRRLKPASRPISKEPGVLAPADGLILHIGPLRNGQIEDVKQINYSVDAFLGLKGDNHGEQLLHDKENNELYNCIIYLAPGDCHRFHSPAEWLIYHRKHFPGTLVSVHPEYMKQSPEILHTNERVCYLGEWSHGFFSLTAVGATNVGSIKVNFDENLRTNTRLLWRPHIYTCLEHKFNRGVQMKAGQDFGEFNFGSTIVLIFEAPKNSTFNVKVDQRIKYGQLMARIDSPPASEQPTAS